MLIKSTKVGSQSHFIQTHILIVTSKLIHRVHIKSSLEGFFLSGLVSLNQIVSLLNPYILSGLVFVKLQHNNNKQSTRRKNRAQSMKKMKTSSKSTIFFRDIKHTKSRVNQ